MKLLGISGSLQASSSNTALLRVACDVAAGAAEVVLFEGLAEIPPFNPDTEPAPPPVEALRSLVKSADGVFITTPEYAFGLPGSLKNALDWLVGSGELYEKPVVVASAAPSAERGTHARADLERTLRAQGARVLASETIAVPSAVRGNEISDQHVREAVRTVLRSFSAP